MNLRWYNKLAPSNDGASLLLQKHQRRVSTTMYISKRLKSMPVLLIGIISLICASAAVLAQAPSAYRVHLPFAVVEGQSTGQEPTENEPTEHELSAVEPSGMGIMVEGQILPPLAGVSDHNRSSSYDSGLNFFNPYLDTTVAELSVFDIWGSPQSGSGTQSIPSLGSITVFPLARVGTNTFLQMNLSQPSAAVYKNFKGFDVDGNRFAFVASTASEEIYFPYLCKCEDETVIGVSNANDDDAIISIEYSDGETVTAEIPAHTHRLIYQFFEEHGDEPFSGKLTSAVPVSAAVLQTDSSTSRGYAALTKSSSPLVFPLVDFEAASTVFTNIRVHNAGSESTDVTITYTSIAATTTCAETQTIDAETPVTFGGSAFIDGTNSDCAFGDGFTGAARITANSTDQPLAGVVDYYNDGAGAASYGALDEDNATDKIAFPVTVNISNTNQTITTSMRIVNAGPIESAVTCFIVGTTLTELASIPSGGSVLITPPVTDPINATAVCVGDEGAKLLAISDSHTMDSSGGQAFETYRGINY